MHSVATDLRLNAAVLCERVLEETDGTISVIRLAEHLVIDVSRGNASGASTIAVPTNLLLVFKRESEEPSEYQLALRVTSPTGREVTIAEIDLAIGSGYGRGIDLIIPFDFPASGAGMHWFAVWANGEVLTRMPIEVLTTKVPFDHQSNRTHRAQPLTGREGPRRGAS
jgi:hypothetical protein